MYSLFHRRRERSATCDPSHVQTMCTMPHSSAARGPVCSRTCRQQTAVHAAGTRVRSTSERSTAACLKPSAPLCKLYSEGSLRPACACMSSLSWAAQGPHLEVRAVEAPRYLFEEGGADFGKLLRLHSRHGVRQSWNAQELLRLMHQALHWPDTGCTTQQHDWGHSRCAPARQQQPLTVQMTSGPSDNPGRCTLA